MDGIANSYKIKVQKEKYLIYMVKPSKWGNLYRVKLRKKIHYMKKLDKNITQVFPLLEFHTPRYAHNPYNFITHYSICEVLISLSHST